MNDYKVSVITPFYNNESYLFDEDYLKMQNCNLETPEVLKNSSFNTQAPYNK